MPKITKHIPVRRGFDTVWFRPGEELPEWAVGLVGEHALEHEPDEGLEPEGFVVIDPAEEPLSATGSFPVEPDSEATPEATPADAAPDFTKPAARRGRAPKKA